MVSRWNKVTERRTSTAAHHKCVTGLALRVRAPSLRSPLRPPLTPFFALFLTHQEAEDEAEDCRGHSAREKGAAAAVGAATAGGRADGRTDERMRGAGAGGVSRQRAVSLCPLPSAKGAGRWGGWDRAQQQRRL